MTAPKPTTKPFRGWAVFNSSGELLLYSLAESRRMALRYVQDHTGTSMEDIKKERAVCRRVIVTEDSTGKGN